MDDESTPKKILRAQLCKTTGCLRMRRLDVVLKDLRRIDAEMAREKRGDVREDWFWRPKLTLSCSAKKINIQ